MKIITDEELDEARRLREQGWTYRQIGDKLCYAHNTIYYALKGQRKGKIYDEIKLKWFYEYFQADKKRTINKFALKLYGRYDHNLFYQFIGLLKGRDVRLPLSKVARLEEITGKSLKELMERREED